MVRVKHEDSELDAALRRSRALQIALVALEQPKRLRLDY
jgi:hypothetical protein